MLRIVRQFPSSPSLPSGLVAQLASPHSSKWPISKSNPTLGPSVAQGTTWPGEAVAYIAWKSNGSVEQSVWFALWTKPLAPLATIDALVPSVRSETSVSTPLAVSLIVTSRLSPLFISSRVPPTVPSVVRYCCVVGSRQFMFWVGVNVSSVLMCSRTHHWVSEQPPNGEPGG